MPRPGTRDPTKVCGATTGILTQAPALHGDPCGVNGLENRAALLRLGLNSLRRSSHACLLYEERNECAEILNAFVEVGAARAEKCLCVVPEGLEASFCSALRTPPAGMAHPLDTGAIELTTMRRACFAAGGLGTLRALGFWREAAEHARAEGFSGLRGLIQMDRPLANRSMRDYWIDYENGLTKVFAEWGGTILCLYNRAIHPAGFIRNALNAHALVAHRGVIGENAFHVPPEEYSAHDRARRETDRILSSVSRWPVVRRQVPVAEPGSDQLRRYCAYLTAAEEIAQTGSWAWNPGSGELFWSRQHFRLFGLDPARDQVSYQRFFQCVHPEDRSELEQELLAAVRSERDIDVEYRIVLADDTIKYIHGRGYPTFGESNKLTEYIGTVADVTERRQGEESLGRMQAELAESSRAAALHQLIAAIAHEVNQPLTAVIANAGAVRRWLSVARPRLDRARRTVARIINDGNRASEVVGRARALIGSTGGAHRSPLLVNSVVREVLVFSRTELRRNRIVVRMKLAQDMPAVTADQIQIQQVLINLITNAIEAMSTVITHPRLLVIATLADTGGAVCSVTDTGIGLSRQLLERVFQPFYTTKPRGMGIGLAISRTIIEAHGGRLWAEENPREGATFRFRLPFGVGRME